MNGDHTACGPPEYTAADAASSPRSCTTDGARNADAPHSTPESTVDSMAMMRQMFEFMSTAQRQNQEQMAQMLQQQVLLQQHMLQAHVAAQKPQKKKGNPPIFHGQASDDLELWLFSTEQYYASYAEEMRCETSEFVNTFFANLGPTAQTWYRAFKLSLGDQPATWTIFKQRIRERFRHSDFQHKVLSKLHNLRWSGGPTSLYDEVSTPALAARLRPHSGSPHPQQLHYQDEDAVPPTRRNKIYGYLCQGGRVEDASVSIFVDSGASFNAIAPEVAANLKLKVTTLQEPLGVKLGGGQRVSIPRRTTTITVSMEGFPEYATEVFVMEIPEGKNVLLGFRWLEDVNTDIDWVARIVRSRGATSGLVLHPCPRALVSPIVAGSRRRTTKLQRRNDERNNLLFYAKHDDVSSVGETKVISHRQFRRMHHDKDAFCFAVRICEDTSDKAARQLSQGWEQLRDRPEEAVVVKYKNTVFRAELPSVAPQRSVDVEAEVELSDDT
ncbi:unnamed protein product [Phytophthora fragariaefolia]|uniref:Unnamed protein product n=1 Tax=Phytophthora fragariaefolia TaxID=1490495 RepID=A0A9W7CZA5_9STRA|nr:unnamed protein product [Phytophthora fragariaefolia]